MCHTRLTEDFSKAKVRKPLTYGVTLYSLFRKVNHRYIRISDMAYTERYACRVFSERLSHNPLELSIRPIKIECLEAR